jgi:hypothetical protein
MIRDYLRGMQMAYFPPFKMLFLLCTLSLLVESGLNIQGVNYIKQSEEEFLEDSNETQVRKEKEIKKLTKVEKERQQKKKEFMDMFHSGEIFLKAYQLQNKYLSLVNLAFMLLFSVPLYLMFRHSPAIPDLRFSECFVTMVYITNMLTIYDIFFTFLSPNETGEIITASLFIPLFIIPIKQLSGYSYWNTIWRTIVALIPFAAIIFVLFIVGIFIYGYIYINS